MLVGHSTLLNLVFALPYLDCYLINVKEPFEMGKDGSNARRVDASIKSSRSAAGTSCRRVIGLLHMTVNTEIIRAVRRVVLAVW